MAPTKRPIVPPRSRPRPKAKPKAKAKQKVDKLKEETTSIVEVADWNSVLLEAPSPKLARVDRRDVEQQVERVIQTRLVSQFSVESSNGVVNSKGEHVRAYIARHIRGNMGWDTYLNSKLWTAFYREFDLQAQGLAGLPAPTGEEEVDEQEEDVAAGDPRVARRPTKPTKAMIQSNELHHADFRDWCEH